MAHESFEDPEVAKILNRHFVSIKVDREERPDVDEIYMTSVQVLTGQGGWPMSVFLTPEGKPFFGGTYFRKADFSRLLKRVAEVWKETPEKIANESKMLTEAVKKNMVVESSQESSGFSNKPLYGFYQYYKDQVDLQYGGVGHAPKFPQTHEFEGSYEGSPAPCCI